MTEITTMMRQMVQGSVEQSRGDRNVMARKTSVVQPTGKIKRQELPLAGPAMPPPKLERVVDDLNVYAQNLKREIRFSLDEGSGRTVIMVIDSISKEVVRQIPAEDIENVSRNLHNHASGIFVQVMV